VKRTWRGWVVRDVRKWLLLNEIHVVGGVGLLLLVWEGRGSRDGSGKMLNRRELYPVPSRLT
jgi:hypothetical protein